MITITIIASVLAGAIIANAIPRIYKKIQTHKRKNKIDNINPPWKSDLVKQNQNMMRWVHETIKISNTNLTAGIKEQIKASITEMMDEDQPEHIDPINEDTVELIGEPPRKIERQRGRKK